MFAIITSPLRVATASLCVILSACGGGGTSGTPAQTSSTGPNLDARVSYVWEFEDATGPVTHQYQPKKDGVVTTVGIVTTCANNAVNCKATQEAGRSGKGLQFYPDSASSFAWISGGDSTSICSSDMLQFDPLGVLDYRMTLALWIKPDRIEAGQTYHLFGTGDPIGGNTLKSASFHLRIVDGKVVMSLYPNAFSYTPDLIVESQASLSAGAGSWHHVAFTYDNFKSALYVDGVLDTTATRKAENRRIKEVCRPYYLGGLSATTSVNGAVIEQSSFVFPGMVDQLLLSNRTYSADEIANLAGKTSLVK